MNILGIIIMVVGMALVIVGRNMGRYLPPNYQEEEEDGFLPLLQSMGSLLAKGGIVFCVVGIICILSGMLS